MVSDQNIFPPSNVSNQRFSSRSPSGFAFVTWEYLWCEAFPICLADILKLSQKKVSWGCASLKIAWILFCPDSVGADRDLEAWQTCPFESQFCASGATFSWTVLRSHGKEQCVNINVEYLSLKITLGCSTNLCCVCCGFLSTACLQVHSV